MKTLPGPYPLITTAEEFKTAESFQLAGEAVCIPLISGTGHGHASMKRIHHVRGQFAVANIMSAAVVKDPSRLRSRYLAQYLNYHKDRLLVPLMTGAANMSLSIDRIKTVPVTFPTLAEQDRIVALLDEADALRKLRVQADARTAQLIPAIFQDMFGGKVDFPMVSTWRSGRTPSKGWKYVKLTDVARLATGHTPSRRSPEYWDGDIPWLTTGEIRSVDSGEVHDTREYITQQGIDNSSAVVLPRGTVCLSRTASVGFVTIMGRDMATSQDFVNWVCGEEIEPFYLMNAIVSVREHIRSMASGSTHKTIYFPTVEQFAIALPLTSEQRRFAARAQEVRDLQAVQAQARAKVEALYQSLLHGAFSGELSKEFRVIQFPVPQPDPSKLDLDQRAALLAYVVFKLEGDRTLGRVKVEKIDHFIESHLAIDLGRTPKRIAAGPADMSTRNPVDKRAERNQWITRTKQPTKLELYTAGPQNAQGVAEAQRILGDRLPEVDGILAHLRPLNGHYCGILATLHAAWNDLLRSDHKPNDREIIRDARENWTEEKKQIPQEDWLWGLGWLRKHGWVPTGNAKPVRAK